MTAALVLDARPELPARTLEAEPDGDTARALQELVAVLRTRLPSPQEVGARWEQVHRTCTDRPLGPLRYIAPVGTSPLPSRYDEFFGVHRVLSLEPDQLAASVYRVITTSSAELASACLDHHDHLAIAQGLASMARLVPAPPEPPGPMFASSAANGHRSPAMARWVTGHHLFFLFVRMTAHVLAAVPPVEDEAADTQATLLRLQLAGRLLRGATAAMVFASALPADVYCQEIRPRMDAASGRHGGFSGTDSMDHMLLRAELARVYDAVSTTSDTALRDAACQFFEILVEDYERHVLIAAAMVGTRPSLKQEHVLVRLGVVASAGQAAVDMLRDMAVAQRARLDAL